MKPEFDQHKGNVSTHHDVFALGDVDHVHHAPDQRHAVCGENKNSADQNPVDQEVNEEDRLGNEYV